MDKSYWQRKAMVERRTNLIKAAKGGKHQSGREIIGRSLEALAKAISGEKLNEADILVIDYLRTGIHDFLMDDIPLDRALLVENINGGRPPIPVNVLHEIFGEISKEAERLKNDGQSKPITMAQQTVARRRGITARKARDIWQAGQAKRLK